MARIDCPKCGRDVAVSSRDVISRHNRAPRRPCLAAGLTPFQIEAHDRDQFALFPKEGHYYVNQSGRWVCCKCGASR